MIHAACEVGRSWPAQQVLAVYPHRCSLLAGTRVARRLGVPLVLYMHDLCAEGLTLTNGCRRRFWQAVDRASLGRARLVLVPTEEFAAHYRRRGIHTTWVLPHCVATAPDAHDPPRPRDTLHLLYSGTIYEPHEDAARLFVRATRGRAHVAVTYYTSPGACDGLLGSVGARWVRPHEAARALAGADVLVVLLGRHTPCADEVHGCFPSKLIEYLSAGRPILALVPPGCFVDRLVSQSACGLVVRRYDQASILGAIDRLRDARVRAEMARNGRRLLRQLRGHVWMDRLLRRLRDGPPATSSDPPFPLPTTDEPEERGDENERRLRAGAAPIHDTTPAVGGSAPPGSVTASSPSVALSGRPALGG